MDRHVEELLRRLRLRPRGYARVRGGVEKRLRRHMESLGIASCEDYLDRLDRDPAFRREVELLTTVSISRFFRDRALWQALEERVLPGLLEQRRPVVHAWSAGCALGQEAYSLRILWILLCRGRQSPPRLEILATDMNPQYLRKAREGLYPASALREAGEDRKRDFFVKCPPGGCLRVADSLRDGIRWKLHDVTRDPPPGEVFQIIFLRNSLLTYYAPEVQESALRGVLRPLAPEGFLVIGMKEALPPSNEGLRPLAEGVPIYRRE